MKIHGKVHRLALDPTPDQDAFLDRCCRIAGAVRNLAILAWEEWEDGEADARPPHNLGVAKILEDAGLPGPGYPTGLAQYTATLTLNNFLLPWQGHPRHRPEPRPVSEQPQFKADEGYGTVVIRGRHVLLPKLGWVKLKKNPRLDKADVLSAIVWRNMAEDGWKVRLSLLDPTVSKRAEKLLQEPLEACPEGYRSGKSEGHSAASSAP